MSSKGQIKRLPTKSVVVRSSTKRVHIRDQHVSVDSKLKPKPDDDPNLKLDMELNKEGGTGYPISDIAKEINQPGLHKILDNAGKFKHNQSSISSMLTEVAKRIDDKGLKSLATKDALSDITDPRLDDIYKQRITDHVAARLGTDAVKKIIDSGDFSKELENSFKQQAPYSELKERYPNDPITKEKGKLQGLLSDIPNLKTDKELVDHFKKNLPEIRPSRMKELDHIFKENAPGLSSYIDNWIAAGTAPESMTLKAMANEKLGAVKDKNTTGRLDKLSPKDKQGLERGLQLSKTLSRAILDKTHPGKDSISLFRGTSVKEISALKSGVLANSNSLSSWSTDRNIGVKFAKIGSKPKQGVVIQSDIPKDDVLATNHFWSYDGLQGEHVVISKKARPANVVLKGAEIDANYDPDYAHGL